MSETIHDAAAAYALGVLDPDEVRAFEAHLEECDRCRSAVASYEATAPARGAGAGGSGRPQVAWWGLAAAAIAALTTVGWWNARERAVDFELRVAELEMAVQIRNNALAERDSLLAIALDLEARDARMVATGQPPSARIVWSPARARVILSVADLAPAPEGRVYQLWAIPQGGDAVSLGVFNPRQDGSGVFVLTVPDELEFDVSAVTEEPGGGSQQPTTTPFLVGTVAPD